MTSCSGRVQGPVLYRQVSTSSSATVKVDRFRLQGDHRLVSMLRYVCAVDDRGGIFFKYAERGACGSLTERYFNIESFRVVRQQGIGVTLEVKAYLRDHNVDNAMTALAEAILGASGSLPDQEKVVHIWYQKPGRHNEPDTLNIAANCVE
jgi:hypothetical protein